MSWIYHINSHSEPEKAGLYRSLIPPELFGRFKIHPITFTDAQNRKLIRFHCPAGEDTTLIELKAKPNDQDAVFSIQISDTRDRTQLRWDFIVVNDLECLRFNIDLDQEGRDTLFGTANRNVEEERKALDAGLAPGQTRRGLRLTGKVISSLENLCTLLGIRSIHLEALFYHNAIVYERHGFTYLEGFKRMKRIHQLFQPGGRLFERLDGSSPFRMAGFHRSVRGRSWAIHDGILEHLEDEILDEPWYAPNMYKMIGKGHSTLTFPAAIY